VLIERAKKESRVFNLDDPDDMNAYNEVIDNPAVRILEKKFIQHTETERSGRDMTETKEVHLFVEWETVCL
jgi:hypothetical protein